MDKLKNILHLEELYERGKNEEEYKPYTSSNFKSAIKRLKLDYKMFEVGENEKKKRIERFNQLEGNKTLRQCYKNKVEIGCTYPQHIEDKLKELDDIITKEDKTPWWVYIID